MVPVVTLDGPAGVGKGTVSQRLARHLEWHYLNSGALYRVLGVEAGRRGVELADVSRLVTLAEELRVEFTAGEEESRTLLAGLDVTDEMATERAGEAASRVAAIPAVREALLNRQRRFCQLPGLIAEGRDMGTVVFPAAALKIFLDASAEERAERRCKQLKANGLDVSLRAVLTEIRNRDERDRNRSVAPLVPAADSVTIDSTDLSVDEVFNLILKLCDERRLLVTTSAPLQL